MTVSDSLKRFRSEYKLTQKAVADALGISTQLYNHYETKGEMNTRVLLAIVERFNVSADYLLGLSDTPNRDVDNALINAALFFGKTMQEILERKGGDVR